MQEPVSRSLIFFAHGSRDPLWHQPVQAIAQHARKLDPLTPVRCAFLELTQPDLPTCVAELAVEGIQSITVVPLFLGVGKHAREDLPLIVAGLKSLYPSITFDLRPAIGEDDRLVEFIAQMALNQA